MSQKEQVYIYLEGQKKYVYLSLSQVSSYSNDNHINTYMKSHVAHSSDKTVDVKSSMDSNRLKLLKNWLDIDTIVSPSDKAQLYSALNFCLAAKMSIPSLSINKYLFDRSIIKTSLKDLMQGTYQTVKDYNENVEKINSIMKNYSLPPVAFYCFEETPVYSYGAAKKVTPFENVVFSDSSPSNILHKHLHIAPITLKPYNKTLINNLIKNADTTSIVSSLDDKKATTEMFLVHTRNGDKEGFIGEDAWHGPLNTAKMFYDERKAQKAGENRNVTSYQIWKVGINFKKPTIKSDNFESSTVMDSIMAHQEKQMLEELMKNQEYKNLLAKSEEYKRLLIEHNILPQNEISNNSPELEKKRNKI